MSAVRLSVKNGYTLFDLLRKHAIPAVVIDNFCLVFCGFRNFVVAILISIVIINYALNSPIYVATE